jgi:hypothetical protein
MRSSHLLKVASNQCNSPRPLGLRFPAIVTRDTGGAISVLETMPRTMRCEVHSMRGAKAAKR